MNPSIGLALLRVLLSWALLSTASWPATAAIWLDSNGQPNTSARDALQLLRDAAADGLEPEDYRAAELAERLEAIGLGPSTAQAAFERDLDSSMLRYLRDLHLGRVDPRTLGFRIGRASVPPPDFAGLLQAAAATGHVRQAAQALRPQLGQYAALREGLARYRALAIGEPLLTLPAGATVRPGDPYPSAPALHRRLTALGDLAPESPPPGDTYDATLLEGIRRFQGRHGLLADGVLGPATLAALNVPLHRRARQLALALERLRWLPGLGRQAFIAINIPMFRLWAWDPSAPAEAPLDMAVVVGRSLDTQTPVLSQEMLYLVFRPYWNVPRSILLNETLPALARDARHLERNDMEIVRGAGDDARPVAASEENLGLLRQGLLRLRQRPGPRNSLGQVKFIFPNDSNVYLHGTPASQLFGRARRDFSHGCVRVEDPAALARWVLKGQPEWTPERIAAAMAGPQARLPPQRVDLPRPMPVVLFYITAMAPPPGRGIHFADDIYGHDARLARALAKRPGP